MDKNEQHFLVPSMSRGSRHVKKFRVSPALLMRIATEGYSGDGVVCTQGLPLGASLMELSLTMPWGDIELLVEHPDFPEVPFDKDVPIMTVTHQRGGS